MFPRTLYAQSAAAERLRDIKWKAILFSICWRNICQLLRAVCRQYVFVSTLVIWGCVGLIAHEYFLIAMFPRPPYAKSAAVEWLQGIKWRAIYISICWLNIFQLWRAVFPQCKFQYRRGVTYIKIRMYMLPFLDISKNAIYPIFRGWMAAGHQMKGSIVFYLLTKYFSNITIRFSAIYIWLNSCHMGMCWHGCARIHPNIDVSKNALYPICCGWMAAGHQMKGNVVFYLLTKYFSIITSRFSAMQVSI